jgi:hypothetical protein
MSMRLEVKCSISNCAIYTSVICFSVLVVQQKVLKIFIRSYPQNHREETELSYNLK